ncbi:hypothetical protein HAP94_14555 [Acidithiobacillus ferrivorans]|nr:hypothetical protein [Acidithiobacillus ferrivorans]
MSVYLKAYCIFVRRVYAILRVPLRILLIFALPLMVPAGTGWLISLAIPGVLRWGVPVSAPVIESDSLLWWVAIWSTGFALYLVLFFVFWLLYEVAILWRDAMREAGKP